MAAQVVLALVERELVRVAVMVPLHHEVKAPQACTPGASACTTPACTRARNTKRNIQQCRASVGTLHDLSKGQAAKRAFAIRRRPGHLSNKNVSSRTMTRTHAVTMTKNKRSSFMSAPPNTRKRISEMQDELSVLPALPRAPDTTAGTGPRPWCLEPCKPNSKGGR